MRIDAHQHFWKYDPVRDGWINSEMCVLRRDFMPDDLAPILRENDIDGCIAVQADQSEDETHLLLNLSSKYEFIKGVVGWVDLAAGNIEERLEYWSGFDKLMGFRHIIQAEPDDSFMLRPDFCRGISGLSQYGFTYDLLVQPRHLPSLLKFVGRFPDQSFVIDHLAKPSIQTGKIDEWKQGIEKLAAFENVFCKLSGMVTEADLNHWKATDFKPYIDAVIGSFGIDRIMFGSDWPVCLLGTSYDKCCAILEQNTSELTVSEKAKLWGLNAAKFYGLPV
jgi:L-fuconolactonase